MAERLSRKGVHCELPNRLVDAETIATVAGVNRRIAEEICAAFSTASQLHCGDSLPLRIILGISLDALKGQGVTLAHKTVIQAQTKSPHGGVSTVRITKRWDLCETPFDPLGLSYSTRRGSMVHTLIIEGCPVPRH